MSIEQPNENIKLSLEQLQQIDIVQKRLSVLESEITNANKVLKGTKMEIDRVVKEKAYQEELLAKLLENTKKAKIEYEELLSNVKISKKILLDNQEKSRVISSSIDNKSQDISKREKQLIVNEKSHDKNVSDFNQKNEKFLKDRSSLEKAQSILLEAIKSVSW